MVQVTRSLLAVVLSMATFIVVSPVAYLVTLLATGWVVWSALIGIFCGFAGATLLNVTDVMARWIRRSRGNGDSGGTGSSHEDGRVR